MEDLSVGIDLFIARVGDFKWSGKVNDKLVVIEGIMVNGEVDAVCRIDGVELSPFSQALSTDARTAFQQCAMDITSKELTPYGLRSVA